MASQPRVLVTGMSMISGLGRSTATNWASVLANRCTITKLDGPEFDGLDCRIGGPLPLSLFNPDDHPTSFKFRGSSLAAALASDCIQDSGIDLGGLTEAQLRRFGVVVSN